MEPDILASPSEAPAAESRTAADQSEAVKVHVNGHANGVANGRVHGHTNGHASGYSNGHANGHAGGHALTAVPRLARDLHHARLAWETPAHNGHGAAAPVAVFAPLDAHADEGMYLRWGKRVLDVVGAAFAMMLSLPVLAIAAIAIKLESPGPVFYRSTRIGRNGRPFTFLKLRSMVQGADRHRHQLTHLNECDGPVFKMSRDPRVTRVGRFLRITSLDEIPQFLNVLRGDMSLVGPRPPIPEEVAQYEPWQLHRLDVRPGITCLWQISGRSRIGFDEWMRLDLEYIRRRSPGLDLQILLRTIPAVLSREGAY